LSIYWQILDFLLIKSCKTYPGPMLPPGSGNGQQKLAAETGSRNWQQKLAAETGSRNWQQKLAAEPGSRFILIDLKE
jgi:hypothetical protein